MELFIARIPTAQGKICQMPKYQTEGSACFDLVSNIDDDICIKSGERILIPSGICVQIPEGYGGFIFARSGLSTEDGICLCNGVGVVDSDYRGEILVGLINNSDKGYVIKPDQRIAQMCIIELTQFIITERDALTYTKRGSSGFGSTGQK